MLATESVSAEGKLAETDLECEPKGMIPKANAKGTPLHFP